MVDEKYQTFRRRFWAGVVDSLVFLPISLADRWMYSTGAPGGVIATWFVVSSLAFLVYSVAMHGKYGQTLGKMAARVKVLDVSESKLSIRQAFIRDSVPILLWIVCIALELPAVLKGMNPYLAPHLSWSMRLMLAGSFAWFVAELGTMLMNEKRRALHDIIAGSVVIRMS